MIAEVNTVIEKKAASGQEAPASQVSDEEFLKIAETLESPSTPGNEGSAEVAGIQTTCEKIAHAAAIFDTILNISQFTKIAEFEASAREQGFSDEQIGEYLTKTAAAKNLSSVRKLLFPALAATGAASAAGAGGHAAGKKSGKEEGYGQALTDVERAMARYNY
jgi:hypothetical protein